MARVLISGCYGSGNLGDELLLAALLRQLRQAAPCSELTVLSRRPRTTEARHQTAAIGRCELPRLMSAMRRCDLLISGGGSLLQDATSSRSLWYYLGVLALAQRMGKDTVIYCQGAGPLRRRQNQALTVRVLSRATEVILRDAESAALLRRIGLKREVTVAADPVLSLPLRRGTGRDNAVAWVIHGRYCTPELERVLRGAMGELARRGYVSLLLPFCPAEDNPALLRLARWGRIVPEKRLWPGLRRCALVISMRLHGLILGAKLGAEVLSLTCDPKTNAFLRQLGHEPGLKLPGLTQRQLVERAEAALRQPQGQNAAALERMTARLETGNRRLWEILQRYS